MEKQSAATVGGDGKDEHIYVSLVMWACFVCMYKGALSIHSLPSLIYTNYEASFWVKFGYFCVFSEMLRILSQSKGICEKWVHLKG